MIHKRAVYCILAFILSGCGELCSNDTSQTIINPSGTLKAVVFSRNCGATTNFNTQVSIIPANKILSAEESGNIFIANDSLALVINWENAKSLRISGIGSVVPIQKKIKLADVVVTYKN